MNITWVNEKHWESISQGSEGISLKVLDKKRREGISRELRESISRGFIQEGTSWIGDAKRANIFLGRQKGISCVQAGTKAYILWNLL